MFSCIDGIHFLYIVQKNPKQIFIAMHVSPNEFRQIRGEKVLSNTKLRQIRLCMPPVSFNFIGMITVFVHEFYRVVHCSVFIAMRLEFGVRFPAVRHYNCSRFNPVLNNGQQCVFVSLLDCHQKTFPAFLLYTSKHPLPFNVMSSVVLSFAKFTFVYLNNLSFSA